MNASATIEAAVRVACALLLLLATHAARADVTYVVNTVEDRIDDVSDGICHTSVNTCALRAAIMQANRLSGPGVTRISLPAGTYLLTRPTTPGGGDANGDLNLAAPLASDQRIDIVGSGMATTIINANQIDRVLAVAQGRSATISDLTLRNGFRQPNAGDGGGILNQGTLAVTRCAIESNQVDEFGGGIWNSGSLVVSDSRIASNVAYIGGGFAVGGSSAGAQTTIVRSSIVGNRADSSGGGIFAESRVTVRDSTISGNSVSGDGGGVFSLTDLRVVSSTVSGNTADFNGGGVRAAGFAALINATVVDNDADHDRDQSGGIGGGIYSVTGTQFALVNTLIARNTILDAPIDDDCNSRVETFGRNLFGNPAGCVVVGPDPTGIILPVEFGPLQDNGGPTATHALLAGSVAIDGTFAATPCRDFDGLLPTDQRGFPRTAGARCDVGAYEFGSVNPTPLIFANGFE